MWNTVLVFSIHTSPYRLFGDYALSDYHVAVYLLIFLTGFSFFLFRWPLRFLILWLNWRLLEDCNLAQLDLSLLVIFRIINNQTSLLSFQIKFIFLLIVSFILQLKFSLWVTWNYWRGWVFWIVWMLWLNRWQSNITILISFNALNLVVTSMASCISLMPIRNILMRWLLLSYLLLFLFNYSWLLSLALYWWQFLRGWFFF